MYKLDEHDRKIVEALQGNARLTNVEVAEIVGLSHSSCSRRIAKLEKSGVILGYRALTDRQKLGLTVRAYCGILRDKHVTWDKLAANLATVRGVISIAAVSGEVDLMLEIVAKDMQDYSQVVLRDITRIEGVNGTHSTFVLEEIKSIY